MNYTEEDLKDMHMHANHGNQPDGEVLDSTYLVEVNKFLDGEKNNLKSHTKFVNWNYEFKDKSFPTPEAAKELIEGKLWIRLQHPQIDTIFGSKKTQVIPKEHSSQNACEKTNALLWDISLFEEKGALSQATLLYLNNAMSPHLLNQTHFLKHTIFYIHIYIPAIYLYKHTGRRGLRIPSSPIRL